MALLAHMCAAALLLAFSLGSLVSLSLQAFTAVLAGLQRGTLDVPDAITVAVSVFLVVAMDVAMLYAATVLRVLSGVPASDRERLPHQLIMLSASMLESATYLYMIWQYDRPDNLFLWIIGAGRALAAPIFATYLSMARALPVGPRDVAYQAALASGKGVIRDVALIASDPDALLARKVQIFRAASIMQPSDAARFDAIIEAVSEDTPEHPVRTEVFASEQDAGVTLSDPPEVANPKAVKTPASQETKPVDEMRSNVQTVKVVPPSTRRRRVPRTDTGRTKVETIDLRARRERAARRILDEQPEISARDLANRIAIATHTPCSQSTAHSIKQHLSMRTNLLSTSDRLYTEHA